MRPTPNCSKRFCHSRPAMNFLPRCSIRTIAGAGNRICAYEPGVLVFGSSVKYHSAEARIRQLRKPYKYKKLSEKQEARGAKPLALPFLAGLGHRCGRDRPESKVLEGLRQHWLADNCFGEAEPAAAIDTHIDCVALLELALQQSQG